MNRIRVNAATGFIAGAALMYAFDPISGKRRRTVAFDKCFSAWKSFLCELDKARRDAGNRTHGLLAGVEAIFSNSETDEDILIQRARSRIGRIVSHPHAVTLRQENVRIVLEGPVLEEEFPQLLREVRSVFGSREIVNRLEVHRDRENIPALQGGVHRTRRSELAQQSWTPVLRVAAGGTGAALLCYGLRTRNARRWAGVLAGTALLARSLSNREFRQIVGIGCGPRAVEFDKAIHIHAALEEVFKFWTHYDNFARFMTHLKEVRDLGNGRSRWVAEGPAGVPVSWEAEITSYIPNKLLAWRSVPGSGIETEGVVRFDRNPDGSTRVGIRLFYTPPAGVLGHLVASLFGADPKREMDDDMVRLKSLIECGKTRAHGVKVTREELTAA